MIDRNARIETILAMELFVGGKITAFEFDDRLQRIETADRTAEWVALELWKHYDDCTDHFVRLVKKDWSYLQRLKLLLASDREVVLCRGDYGWASGALASAGLGIFAMAMFHADLGNAIAWGLLMSSSLAWWIARRSDRSKNMALSHSPEVAPFHSFSELRSIRRAVPDFRKRPFPANATGGMRRAFG